MKTKITITIASGVSLAIVLLLIVIDTNTIWIMGINHPNSAPQWPRFEMHYLTYGYRRDQLWINTYMLKWRSPYEFTSMLLDSTDPYPFEPIGSWSSLKRRWNYTLISEFNKAKAPNTRRRIRVDEENMVEAPTSWANEYDILTIRTLYSESLLAARSTLEVIESSSQFLMTSNEETIRQALVDLPKLTPQLNNIERQAFMPCNMETQDISRLLPPCDKSGQRDVRTIVIFEEANQITLARITTVDGINIDGAIAIRLLKD